MKYNIRKDMTVFELIQYEMKDAKHRTFWIDDTELKFRVSKVI
jgi:hypothetical protein